MVARVLVAEDEPLIRMLVVDLCESAGFDVLEAANADQALAVLTTQGPIALLHTDIDMPGGLDGVELAWEGRKLQPDIAVIVVSGKMTVPLDSLPPGSKFFSKPVQDADLLNAMEQLLAVRA